MTTPLPVLVARLEHELESARLYLSGESNARGHLNNAQNLAKEIRESL